MPRGQVLCPVRAFAIMSRHLSLPWPLSATTPPKATTQLPQNRGPIVGFREVVVLLLSESSGT